MSDRFPSRNAAAALAVGLGVACVVPLLRRSAGATSADLSVGEACVLTAAVTLVAAVVSDALLDGRHRWSRYRAGAALLFGMTFAAGVVGGTAELLACLATSATIAVTAALASVEAFARPETASVPSVDLDERRLPPVAAVASAPSSPEPAPLATATPLESAADEAGLPHSITRSGRGADERLEAVLPVEFPAGETVQTLHLPLWPPLSGDPEVACELDGVDGRVRVPLAKPYGLRIEVRLPEPCDEPLCGAVRLTATRKAA